VALLRVDYTCGARLSLSQPSRHAPILLGQLSIADFQSLLGCNGFHLLRGGA
jgi:hypothetical protein